jgi:hypothetical protein
VTLRKLDKTEWGAFFESLTRALQGAQAEIDAMSLSIGAQAQTGWLPLFGLVYDEKDDVLEVALEGLDHLIPKPAEIFFDEQAGMIGSLEVTDRAEVKQIVRFRQPLALAGGAR